MNESVAIGVIIVLAWLVLFVRIWSVGTNLLNDEGKTIEVISTIKNGCKGKPPNSRQPEPSSEYLNT